MPALIAQVYFFEGHPSLTVLTITSNLDPALFFRLGVGPSESTGLFRQSQTIVGKVHTVF